MAPKKDIIFEVLHAFHCARPPSFTVVAHLKGEEWRAPFQDLWYFFQGCSQQKKWGAILWPTKYVRWKSLSELQLSWRQGWQSRSKALVSMIYFSWRQQGRFFMLYKTVCSNYLFKVQLGAMCPVQYCHNISALFPDFECSSIQRSFGLLNMN